MTNANDVLQFWFDECKPSQWFEVDPSFDDLIRTRFGDLLVAASQCELYEWRSNADGRLAEIIILDQFSRNAFRSTPQAFAQDPLALGLSQEAVAAGALDELGEMQRAFLLMPYMHSESRAIHAVAEDLFKKWTPATNYDFELRHKVIIDRFGRYPLRNEILRRDSTEEELEFLRQPNSSF